MVECELNFLLNSRDMMRYHAKSA